MVYLGPTAQSQSMSCRAGTYNMHDCKADNDDHNHMGDKMQSGCLSPLAFCLFQQLYGLTADVLVANLMTMHQCTTCERQFTRPQHLDQHLKRKQPCQSADVLPDLTRSGHECDICGKSYHYQPGLSRHRKQCKNPNKTVDQQLQELREDLARLKTQIAGNNHGQVNNNSIHHSSITNVTNNVNNVTNVQVVIKTYGKENMDCLESLSYEQLKKVLNLSPDHAAIISMVKFMHRNPDHPENNNLKLDSKDSNVINVHQKGVWTKQQAHPLLFDLICKKSLHFVDIEGQLSSKMRNKNFEALKEYLGKAEDMANAEDASLHPQHDFPGLLEILRETLI